MPTHTRGLPRRIVIALLATGVAGLALTAVTPKAHASASDPTPLAVVGTSDVSDSMLIQNAITPGFEAKYPQYMLNYTGTGSGQAIADAEAGTAAALIVHAPSIENQFVSQGYSEEPFGRAIFWGDFVLAGPPTDPAGVLASAPTNPIKAFEAIAKAGAAGNAEFISRGGNPGTTIAEHQIWAKTTGVKTCDVDAADGGGASPSTTSGPCTPTTINYPSWYKATGDKQAANILDANSCNFGADTDDCYVFTDRGTFNYLQTSPTPPSNLHIVTRNTAKTAPTATGQLLVNTFHAYVINPASVPANSATDVTGATDLLNYITSPEGQAKIGQYLDSTNDAPFLPDAAPSVYATNPPDLVSAGRTLHINGSLTNVVPGTPALVGQSVSLMSVPTATPNATPTAVATGTTDSDGKFHLTYTPTMNRTYTLDSAPITQVERPDLSPPFADMLQATSTSLGEVDVQGTFSNVSATSGSSGHLTVTGSTSPKHYGDNAHITLYARPAGSSGDFSYVGLVHVKAGYHSFSATYKLAKGSYSYYVKYVNAGYITPGNSAVKSATVS